MDMVTAAANKRTRTDDVPDFIDGKKRPKATHRLPISDHCLCAGDRVEVVAVAPLWLRKRNISHDLLSWIVTHSSRYTEISIMR